MSFFPTLGPAARRGTGLAAIAEEVLDVSRRTIERRVAIRRALGWLPHVRDAYERGELGMEAAWMVWRALGREPAGPELEREWVEHAREVTVKNLHDDVRLLNLRRHAVLDGGALDHGVLGPEVPDREAPGRDVPGHEGQGRDVPDLDTPDEQGQPGKGLEVPEEEEEEDDDDYRHPPTDAERLASLRCVPGMTRDRVAQLGARAVVSQTANVFLRLQLPGEMAEALLTAIGAACQQCAAEAESAGGHSEAAGTPGSDMAGAGPPTEQPPPPASQRRRRTSSPAALPCRPGSACSGSSRIS